MIVMFIKNKGSNDAVKLVYKKIKLNQKKGFFDCLCKKIIEKKLFNKYHIVVGDKCVIGDNLILPHPQNIIFGNYVQIGNNCKIFQDVTFGLKNTDGSGMDSDYPTLKDNCIVCCGAVVLGGIVLSEGTVVGANAVLSTSTKAYTLYAGVPAVMKKRII